MKRIDRLLIKSFIPPFFLAFLIALFVLVMQTLFIYMDDFLGKNLGLLVVTELIFWLSISLFPMALAIGVLLSSVLVFGNMGEKYELSSFKSAGISLFRIMGSLIVLVSIISWFSYYCSDYLNPKAKLQFHSKMWDIRRQKPTLSLEEKTFNYDFSNFTIWLDGKDGNEQDIEGVLVYNQKTNSNNVDVTSSESGKMYSDERGDYFVMHLEDGVQYSEQYQKPKSGNLSYPFVRTEFKSWKKAFDLNEFELGSTDQEMFKFHQYMRTAGQLVSDIDSFQMEKDSLTIPLDIRFHRLMNIEIEQETEEPMRAGELGEELESIATSGPPDRNRMNDQVITETEASIPEGRIMMDLDGEDETGFTGAAPSMDKGPQVNIEDKAILEARPFELENHFDQENIESIYSIATTTIKNLQYDILKTKSENSSLEIKLAKFKFELHSKFSLAAACFIFLFIGAPMGAIVRKGGFGYPLLISIIFFALYVISSIAMKKMAETLKIDGILGAWLPTLIIFAIGVFLTIKAKNDSKIMDLDIIVSRVRKFVLGVFKQSVDAT